MISNISNEELEKFKKEGRRVSFQYDAPPTLVQPKAGIYSGVVRDYDDRDIRVEAAGGKRFWLLREYTWLTTKEQLNRLKK